MNACVRCEVWRFGDLEHRPVGMWVRGYISAMEKNHDT